MRALLLVYAAAFTALVGVPLVVAPLAWARLLGWRTPEPAQLTIYFARCLGAVVIVVAAFGARASSDPPAAALMLELIAALFAAIALVHAWGWLRRSQPLAEDLETIAYAGLVALTLAVRFTA